MSKKVKLKDALKNAELFIDGDWIESKDQDQNGDIRLIQLADIGNGKYLNKSSRFMTSEKAEKLKCTFIEKGDILLARMPEPLGRSCLFLGDEKPCVTVVDICIIRPDKTINRSYLNHQINSSFVRNQINNYITGTTRKRISRSNLGKVEILLPSLEKQKQIAKTLDKANELIELRKESITKLDALAKSIFIDMFGDPAINPKKFDVKLLDEVSLKITDGEHGTVERTDTGKMYLMARNISHFGTIDFSDVSYISEENHNRIYKRCNAEYNDLLLVCVGATIGKCTLVPKMESFSLARSVALIKPSLDKILSNYLLHFFRSEYIGREIKSASNSSAQAGLYLGAIKKIKIIVPPIELQNKFAKIIEKIEEQKSLYEKELEKLQNNFDALLQKSFQE